MRLFAVLRFESVIHEFDPYFNFRTTKFLTNEGFYNFHNWFDDHAWYPLGRIIGGTIYPGLMATAAVLYYLVNLLNITMNIRNVCVFLAPWMASNTAIVTYLFTREVMLGRSTSKSTIKSTKSSLEEEQLIKRKAESSGLLAAAFVGMVPGYISRSVAGSYDNEGVAIFALIITFYYWIKALNNGSLIYSLITALWYFYMVSAWGGYVFIMNIIPLHVLFLLICGKYSTRLYITYSSFYALGTLLSMQISFVGFQPIYSSECLGALGVFGIIQIYAFVDYIKGLVSKEDFIILCKSIIVFAVSIVGIAFIIMNITGFLAPWTGRFYSLLDPTYAKAHIPIIASVSEHQPTSWSSYFFDLHILVFFIPSGLYLCFKSNNEGKIFLITYALTTIYFSGVMVRLMLVLSPIACVLGGIYTSEIMTKFMSIVLYNTDKDTTNNKKKNNDNDEVPHEKVLSIGVILFMSFILCNFGLHSVWVTASAYSSPSIVLAAGGGENKRILDDFREAYYWLRMNTKDDAKIMSWWDYGYQITAIANRTVLVDNNTWNNTHIATVGRAFASSEDDAYPIMKSLDVDYVLIIFGGLSGYSGDDINKFLWMVRIGAGVYPDEIQEDNYYSSSHQYVVDSSATDVMKNCLMYKLSYYRFAEISQGYDRARNSEIGIKDIKLHHLEEALTSEHWIVRIYRVLKEPNFSSE